MIVQTLGAIVQAYASILAIVGAFYIFVIERTQSEFRDTEKRVDIQVDALSKKSIRISDFPRSREKIKEGGPKWLSSEISKVRPKEEQNKILDSQEYFDLIHTLNRYQSLKKRTGVWILNLFYGLFAYCSIMLFITIGLMYAISLGLLLPLVYIIYPLIIILAVSGIFYFIIYVVKI